MITGAVPAPPGTAQVSVRRGTEAVARRRASANPPRLALQIPRRGGRLVVRGPRMGLRWRATDPDGDSLTATVEFSADAGRTWNTVSVGPGSTSARVSRAVLTPTRRGRVRVLVDDGFHEVVATSGRVRVAPTPPRVRIVEPARGEPVRADAPLTLRGEAFGAGGRPLPFRALRWFDGRRPLGRGATLTVRGLTPGAHRLRLKAVEGRRRGRATVPVTVQAVRPAFLRLDVPARISPRARIVRLRVATTVAARLRVGRQRFSVGPQVRSIRVGIQPAGGPLKLVLRLRVGGQTATQPIVVPRG